MASSIPGSANAGAAPTGWQQFSRATVSAFHTYAGWLVRISWTRFFLLSLALMIVAGIVSDALSWSISEVRHAPAAGKSAKLPALPEPPKFPEVPKVPNVRIERAETPASGAADKSDKAAKTDPADESDGIDISIGPEGVRIRPRGDGSAKAASGAASGASAPAATASTSIGPVQIEANDNELIVKVPPGANSEAVREAVNDARDAIREAIDDAAQAARDAAEASRDAAEAQRDAAEALADGPVVSTRTAKLALPQFAILWIVASMILKITYKGRIQAEVKAAQAVETAEAESLKRQVMEARMAAMQAQVEPHFLFNTLASIDHLIETDPNRASKMQKNLITLLRASMPTMREASDGGARALGRELAVIRPYLEILKVRMEERLTTEINVPNGLLSAAFPPMMIQTLVENAIKHGLEPKPEGGHLKVAAEVVHGKLAVTVADTGVGFGKAATAGTGVGLANIRERLELLYGKQATLVVAENQPSGTVITVTVPYRSIEGAAS
jgi:Histidine kinase/Histidine kinase-, DNA gyrase B-, and HSP90-like ATPase